ncbi:MAG TPA: hypothetical protein VFU71_21230 [Burkholderiaceae bacterium]|nr:hypothetical protein [Burkholderiaceae bacterium]
MLALIKRWWSAAAPKPGLPGVEQWAREHGTHWRRLREGEGFVIDGAHRSVGWRMEWGPSHRPYISGTELRCIAELGLHRDLQLMVLNRLLMDASEAKVYDEYVQGVQTRIDTQTPTEIRWLVMYSKLSATELRALAPRFGGVASVKPWLLAWIDGALTDALLDAARNLSEADAFVLSVTRGRLSLRLAMREPRPDRLSSWLRLFETAIDEARRVAGEWRDSALPNTSTRPSVWPRDSRLGE